MWESLLLLSTGWMIVASGDPEKYCPCLPPNVCPRIYGYSPNDSKQIGNLPPCSDLTKVRCCGASLTVITEHKGTTELSQDYLRLGKSPVYVAARILPVKIPDIVVKQIQNISQLNTDTINIKEENFNDNNDLEEEVENILSTYNKNLENDDMIANESTLKISVTTPDEATELPPVKLINENTTSENNIITRKKGMNTTYENIHLTNKNESSMTKKEINDEENSQIKKEKNNTKTDDINNPNRRDTQIPMAPKHTLVELNSSNFSTAEEITENTSTLDEIIEKEIEKLEQNSSGDQKEKKGEVEINENVSENNSENGKTLTQTVENTANMSVSKLMIINSKPYNIETMRSLDEEKITIILPDETNRSSENSNFTTDNEMRTNINKVKNDVMTDSHLLAESDEGLNYQNNKNINNTDNTITESINLMYNKSFEGTQENERKIKTEIKLLDNSKKETNKSEIITSSLSSPSVITVTTTAIPRLLQYNLYTRKPNMPLLILHGRLRNIMKMKSDDTSKREEIERISNFTRDQYVAMGSENNPAAIHGIRLNPKEIIEIKEGINGSHVITDKPLSVLFHSLSNLPRRLPMRLADKGFAYKQKKEGDDNLEIDNIAEADTKDFVTVKAPENITQTPSPVVQPFRHPPRILQPGRKRNQDTFARMRLKDENMDIRSKNFAKNNDESINIEEISTTAKPNILQPFKHPLRILQQRMKNPDILNPLIPRFAGKEKSEKLESKTEVTDKMTEITTEKSPATLSPVRIFKHPPRLLQHKTRKQDFKPTPKSMPDFSFTPSSMPDLIPTPKSTQENSDEHIAGMGEPEISTTDKLRSQIHSVKQPLRIFQQRPLLQSSLTTETPKNEESLNIENNKDTTRPKEIAHETKVLPVQTIKPPSQELQEMIRNSSTLEQHEKNLDEKELFKTEPESSFQKPTWVLQQRVNPQVSSITPSRPAREENLETNEHIDAVQQFKWTKIQSHPIQQNQEYLREEKTNYENTDYSEDSAQAERQNYLMKRLRNRTRQGIRNTEAENTSQHNVKVNEGMIKPTQLNQEEKNNQEKTDDLEDKTHTDQHNYIIKRTRNRTRQGINNSEAENRPQNDVKIMEGELDINSDDTKTEVETNVMIQQNGMIKNIRESLKQRTNFMPNISTKPPVHSVTSKETLEENNEDGKTVIINDETEDAKIQINIELCNSSKNIQNQYIENFKSGSESKSQVDEKLTSNEHQNTEEKYKKNNTELGTEKKEIINNDSAKAEQNSTIENIQNQPRKRANFQSTSTIPPSELDSIAEETMQEAMINKNVENINKSSNEEITEKIHEDTKQNNVLKKRQNQLHQISRFRASATTSSPTQNNKLVRNNTVVNNEKESTGNQENIKIKQHIDLIKNLQNRFRHRTRAFPLISEPKPDESAPTEEETENFVENVTGIDDGITVMYNTQNINQNELNTSLEQNKTTNTEYPDANMVEDETVQENTQKPHEITALQSHEKQKEYIQEGETKYIDNLSVLPTSTSLPMAATTHPLNITNNYINDNSIISKNKLALVESILKNHILTERAQIKKRLLKSIQEDTRNNQNSVIHNGDLKTTRVPDISTGFKNGQKSEKTENHTHQSPEVINDDEILIPSELDYENELLKLELMNHFSKFPTFGQRNRFINRENSKKGGNEENQPHGNLDEKPEDLDNGATIHHMFTFRNEFKPPKSMERGFTPMIFNNRLNIVGPIPQRFRFRSHEFTEDGVPITQLPLPVIDKSPRIQPGRSEIKSNDFFTERAIPILQLPEQTNKPIDKLPEVVQMRQERILNNHNVAFVPLLTELSPPTLNAFVFKTAYDDALKRYNEALRKYNEYIKSFLQQNRIVNFKQ